MSERPFQTRRSILRLVLSSGLGLVATAPALAQPTPVPHLDLRTEAHPDLGVTLRRGTLTVWENRAAKTGRTLELDVVILPARSQTPAPDPVVFLHGGPGVAAADRWRGHVDSWERERNELILLNQRGTGGRNRLDCGGAVDVQSLIDPGFDGDTMADCLETLKTRADLRWYGTDTAMDDLDDLRRLLGHERVNLVGGSYGTRAALVYLRRHGAHARTAILNGVAPIAFRNPLYHAQAAQRAIELIAAECAADPDCAAAYPDVLEKLSATLVRLDAEPGRATVTDRATGRTHDVRLSRDAFAEALRMLMYFDSREVPDHVERAFRGDYDVFAQRALESNSEVREAIAFGMLLCVTCAEDVDRIDPEEIAPLTERTFLGDRRVRAQIDLCAMWPRSVLSDAAHEPVRSTVPVLLLSGTLDPVTDPRFAEIAARHLPNGLALTVPGSHGVGGPCLDAINREFLDRGTTHGLDTECVEGLSPGAFVIAP